MKCFCFYSTIYCLLCFGITAVSAQSVVILPPYVELDQPGELPESITNEITHYLEKQAEMQVIKAEELKSRLPTELQCYENTIVNDSNCMTTIRRASQADIVVTFALFKPLSKEDKPELAIKLIDSNDSIYTKKVIVSEPVKAAHDVIAEVMSLQQQGPGPWVTLTGRPDGATVVINEKEVGKLPVRMVRIKPGDNHIVVSHPSYEDYSYVHYIPDNPGYEESIEIDLTEIEEEQPLHVLPHQAGLYAVDLEESNGNSPILSEKSIESDDSRLFDYILSGVLIAGGLVLAVPPLIKVLNVDDCKVSRTAWGCPEQEVSMEWYQYAGLALGGIMFVGGTVTLLVTIFDNDDNTTTLSLRGQL